MQKKYTKIKILGASALLTASVIGCSTLYDQLSSNMGDITTLLPTNEVLSMYNDGEYLGDSVQADRWGSVQVRAIIEGGVLTDIELVDYPRSTGHSDRIGRSTLPTLMQEAIQDQSADVDIISGATPTSIAFIDSLQSALDQAANGASI